MRVCMYPAIAAPDRLVPDYVSSGESELKSGFQHGSVVVPGERIFSSVANLITGHGTYRNADTTSADAESGKTIETSVKEALGDVSQNRTDNLAGSSHIRTSLTGRVCIVNKLVYVEPPRARYFGNVGDTVVGRITEVEQRRWRVDINSALLANLALANVKLPGGELRRKSEDDERAMRSFMKEGDLIVAEVREVYRDGTLQLHMPGTRTGKLGGGCLLRIPPSLIKRQKIHKHRLAVPRTDSMNDQPASTSSHVDVIPVGLILGCNGYVWIGPARAMDIGMGLAASTDLERDNDHKARVELLAERYAVCRLRNCVLALTRNSMPVWETSVLAACEASWLADQQDEDEDVEMDIDHPGSSSIISNRIARLLHPEISRRLVSLVQAKLKSTF